jgi:hypothetical protein
MKVYLRVGLAVFVTSVSVGCGVQERPEKEMLPGTDATEIVAAGSDQCRDILKEGVFQHRNYRENAFFQQIIYSRFLSSTYQQSKSDKGFGFGVPIGEMLIGGDYSEQAFDEKKADIQRTYSNSTTTLREVDVALTTGDEQVVSAWSNCMRDKGGLSLRFEAVTPTQIFATLEWFAAHGIPETVLNEGLALPPGAKIDGGHECLRKGKRLVASNPCQATITLPNATIPWAATINSRNGSARAYLPPRIMLHREVRAFVFTKEDSLETYAKKQTLHPQREVALAKKDIDDGWRFNPSSWRITLDNSKSCGPNGSSDLRSEATLYSVSYRFTTSAATSGPYSNCVGAGRVHPSIMLVRERWVPMSTIPPVTEGIGA